MLKNKDIYLEWNHRLYNLSIHTDLIKYTRICANRASARVKSRLVVMLWASVNQIVPIKNK